MYFDQNLLSPLQLVGGLVQERRGRGIKKQAFMIEGREVARSGARILNVWG